MLEQVSNPRETWNSLQSRFTSRFSSEQIKDIDTAYQIAKAAHRGQQREDGERYFEHPRAIALIFLDELSTNDPKFVISSLLHDVPEDTAVFGNPQKIKPYSEWRAQVLERLTKTFDSDVAEIVISVTKPEVDNIEILNKEQSQKVYEENLRNSPNKALLVKMADRLHNLRTLGVCSEEKRKRKIAETKDVYLPIFERAFDSYPIETAYLFEQIVWEIEKLEAA